jgi:hypothetical protein
MLTPNWRTGSEKITANNAACCAAQAGSGDGEDAADLSEQVRASWRERARLWLHDDVVAKRALLSGTPTALREALPGKLESWGDLA